MRGYYSSGYDRHINEHEYKYNEYEDRYTFIMKLYCDGTYFICNRNSEDFDNVFNDKYVKFWEVNQLSSLKISECKGVDIIETLDYDNRNRRHQKYINVVKEKHIKELVNEGYNLSNKELMNINKSYRHYYQNEYYEFKKMVIDMNRDPSFINILYDISKKMYFNDNNGGFFNRSRYDIWKDKRLNNTVKVCSIILRDYVYYQKKYKRMLYINKKLIRKTLRELIDKVIEM